MRRPFVRLGSVRSSICLREDKAGRILGLLKDVESGNARFAAACLSIRQRRCQECLDLVGLHFHMNMNNEHAGKIAFGLTIERTN